VKIPDHVQKLVTGHAEHGNMRLKEIISEVGGVGVVAGDKKSAKDPRYSNSMTVDIKPGETKRQAAKFGNNTNKIGLPPIASTNGKI
jgi:hypothetical protein